MFSNDLRNRLNLQAKPTLFNIPNPLATVGGKRRDIQKIAASHSPGKHKVTGICEKNLHIFSL